MTISEMERSLQVELNAVHRKLEKAEARCAELEFRAIDYLGSAAGLAESSKRIKARMALEDAINRNPDPKPFILRKQAEAVDGLIDCYSIKSMSGNFIWEEGADDYAQRLRTQADELEKSQ